MINTYYVSRYAQVGNLSLLKLFLFSICKKIQNYVLLLLALRIIHTKSIKIKQARRISAVRITLQAKIGRIKHKVTRVLQDTGCWIKTDKKTTRCFSQNAYYVEGGVEHLTVTETDVVKTTGVKFSHLCTDPSTCGGISFYAKLALILTVFQV